MNIRALIPRLPSPSGTKTATREEGDQRNHRRNYDRLALFLPTLLWRRIRTEVR
jgi:hypothetical protein